MPFRACLAVLAASALTCATAAAQERDAFTVTGPKGVYSATTAEVAHWSRVVRMTDTATREFAREVTMQLLLGFAWIDAEADEQGLAASPAAVERAYRRQRRANFATRRAFRRFLRQSGQTTADLRYRVRIDMLSNRIRRRILAAAEATVTDAEVDAYHAEHGNVRLPEARDVRMVLTRDRESAAAAKRELLAGASWRSVARRRSLPLDFVAEPDRPGGIIRRLERADIVTPAAGRIFRARRGTVGGPVRTTFGHLVFRVSRIRAAGELSAAHSRRIHRRNLVEDAGLEAVDRFVIDFRAKWRSRTVCAPAYAVVDECGP